VLTSNEVAGLAIHCGAAACTFGCEHPSIERETRILEKRTPEPTWICRDSLLGSLTRFGLHLEKPPSIAEMLDLAEALKILGVHELAPTCETCCYPSLRRHRNDRKRLLLRMGFESLVYDTQHYSRNFDEAARRQEEQGMRRAAAVSGIVHHIEPAFAGEPLSVGEYEGGARATYSHLYGVSQPRRRSSS